MIYLHKADLLVFAFYFLIFVTIAFYAGRKKRVLAADFFINQNRLPWFVIGFSMIASGISSEQFLGTVGFAYEHGLSVANWEWLNGPSILILVFLFIPFYLKKKIVTMPHFLEHRFDGRVRTIFALISVLIYVFINLAGVIYSGGFALSRILHLNIYLCIWIIAFFAAFFVMYGGMATIAWTNVFQASMLLISGLLLFLIGLLKVPGGFSSILGEGSRSHLILPASDPDIPWTGLLVLVLSTNIWYYCTNQNINQSTLGAKNQWHAQIGILFAGFLWLFIPFADTFPGLIAYALNPDLPKDNAFIYAVQELLPTGLTGIVFAVLCAAVITAIQAGVNGVSTIFTFDFYQRFIKPSASEKELIRTGRIFTAAVLLLGATWAPMVLRFGHIFSYFQECWAFVAIPIATVFVAGILWRKFHAKVAFYILLLTFPMFLMPYVLRILKIQMNVFNVAGITLFLTVLLVVFLTFMIRPVAEENKDQLIFSFSSSENSLQGIPWYRKVPFWAVIMMLLYAGVYALFW